MQARTISFSGSPGSSATQNIALTAPPGAGGGVGPSSLVVDHISLGIRVATLFNDQWEVQLRDGVGGSILWRCPLTVNSALSNASSLSNFQFYDGTGPRVSSATPTLVIIQSITLGGGSLTSYRGSISFHFE